MTPEDYAQFDGIGLARLIKRGEISPAEAVKAALERIAQTNPAINAVIETWGSRTARKIAALPDLPGGPLAGVPFLLKDVGGSEPGVSHECGSRLARDMAPDKVETALMRRYREAGLISIGRATSPEFAFNITSENILHGPTRNPWSLRHSPGGSSGGASAAVAAGMVPIAEANDGGGSIRIPAACCGLFGLKPSRGRISMAPGAWEYLCGLSATHVVSRSVRDSAAALDAATGAEPGDPYPVRAPERSYLAELDQPLGSLRVGLMLAPWNGGALHPDCRRATLEAAALIADMGVVVEEATPDLGIDWEGFMLANARIWCSNIALWIDGLAAATGRPIGTDTLERSSLACYHFGKSMSAYDLLDAVAVCNMVSRKVGQFFERYDLLLTPSLPQPPHLLGVYDANADYADGLAWTRKIFGGSPYTPTFNVTGQPAVSIPWDLNDEGLPIGVHFAARMGDEAGLFRMGAAIERARPWAQRRPPLALSLAEVAGG
ncbi:amidase [Govanella unica]|uniref:Amidase n=1 Tax=Govanella unica TaxID=2975056 RepID=A0A9X3TZC5_9PROT|nr:amidase [Govania unica]MDA5194227.1 amidase [Govania unica]